MATQFKMDRTNRIVPIHTHVARKCDLEIQTGCKASLSSHSHREPYRLCHCVLFLCHYGAEVQH